MRLDFKILDDTYELRKGKNLVSHQSQAEISGGNADQKKKKKKSNIKFRNLKFVTLIKQARIIKSTKGYMYLLILS